LVLSVFVGARLEAEDAPPATGAAPVLARFLARPDEPVTRYRARRRMEVRAFGRQAWMNVRVALEPGRGFEWTVESEGGSPALRERSLVRMLEAEAEAYASGTAARGGLTADNYVIAAAGVDGDGLVRLSVTARRREPMLLDGFFVVTPDTADLVRVEGRLARGPSFWVPRADVVRHFARLRGHRVVVRSESRGRLRPFGESRLLVTYEYEMIDGDPIPTSGVLAELAPASP
jgi:hypothetical protein